MRLMPYWIISGAIKKSASKSTRVFYFHPYELDPEDTKLQHKTRSMTTILYWMQQKLGRGSNPDKLRHLLTEFKFQSFENILSGMNLKR